LTVILPTREVYSIVKHVLLAQLLQSTTTLIVIQAAFCILKGAGLIWRCNLQ